MRRPLALFLLAALTPARAQVSVDATLGPTINWVGDTEALRISPEGQQSLDVLRFSPTVGVQAGLGLSVGANGPVAVRTSARLATTGPVFDLERGLARSAFALDVLTVGLELQLRRRAGPLEALVFGGPELRYAVDLRDRDGVGSAIRGFRESVEPLSGAAVIGAGLRVRAFGTAFGPEVRYAFGLSDVSAGEFSESGTTVRLEDGLRLRQLALGLVVGR